MVTACRSVNQRSSRRRRGGAAQRREHASRHARGRRRRAQQAGRALEPQDRRLQLGRQALQRQLAVQDLVDSRIEFAHRCSFNASNSASRARCTRIFNVGMRSPVTAAISS